MKIKSAVLAASAALLAGVAQADPFKVAFTFDDGFADQYERVAPLLEKYGFRGTFNLITDDVGKDKYHMTWAQAKDLARRGHAIESHTKSHVDLRALAAKGDLEGVRREIVVARDAIKREVGVAPQLVCYPFSAASPETDAAIVAAGMRVMNPARRNFGGARSEAVEFINQRKKADAGYADLLTHGIDKKLPGYRPFDSVEVFEAHLKAVKALVDAGEVEVVLYRDIPDDVVFPKAAAAAPRRDARPVKVILDTDMIMDYDDMGALACLHAMADAGECEILATVSCTRRNGSVAAVEICNAYYGRPSIPVGCSKAPSAVAQDKNLPGHRKFLDLQKKYPGRFKYADSDDAPDAVDVYRRVLAAQPDGSVVVCSLGFFTNMRALLESKGDSHSPLGGRALVAKKVKKWVAMGCCYPQGHEYNSDGDPESTKIALRDWPTPVVITDFQYGRHLYAGRALAESAGDDNPVKDLFKGALTPRAKITPYTWDQLAGHPAWDESAVLIAVRGEESYFALEHGFYDITDARGNCVWRYNLSSRSCRVLQKTPRVEVGKVIDELMTRKPKNRWGK